MSAAFGVLLGMGLATVILAAHIAVRTRRSAAPEAAAMQVALHAATATLPYLRHGLTRTTAELAVPHLRALTGAAAIALADSRAVLAIDGDRGKQVRPGDLLTRLLDRTRDDHMKIVPHLISSDSACSLHSAVLVPLLVQRKRTGTLITFYRSTGRPSEAELRVVQEAANLGAIPRSCG
jgi:two-component system, LytTR family, sensor kinase